MRGYRAYALVFAAFVATNPTSADDPWFIIDSVTITEPMEVEDIILLGNGSLTVSGVPAPGLQLTGNLWALGSSEVLLEDSVIQFMSTYHGQYALAAAENSRVTVTGCDYRVPNGVQHGLIAVGSAELLVEDTDFGDVQLLSAETARVEASRLNGNFEVIVQHDSQMELADIPREPDEGKLWVWVEFPPGSEAVYTPPMPGFIDSWSYPPPGSTGILQTVQLERCEALLWPMLVRENSHVTLRDVAEENWIVVGFHMFADATVSGLYNATWYSNERLELSDRDFHLENASIDTWNLYPQAEASVTVRDSQLGEILSMGDARVWVHDTVIDGSGGFFGARDSSRIVVSESTLTCTVEATQESTIEFHDSVIQPYEIDPTGAFTRFGAYDDARLFANNTPVFTTPALGASGLIAVSYIADPPARPPEAGETVTLFGIAAQFSLDEEVAPGSWRLDVVPRVGGHPETIASGEGNVEEEVLGYWSGAVPGYDHKLDIVLTDGLGRTLVGGPWILGTGTRTRRSEGTRQSP